MNIRFNDLISLLAENKTFIEDYSQEAQNLRDYLDAFGTDNTLFQGKGATAMKAYLKEVHGAILLGWSDCLSLYLDLLCGYKDSLIGIDNDESTIINSIYIGELTEMLVQSMVAFTGDENDVSVFYTKYQNHLAHSKPSAEVILGNLGVSRDIANSELDRMGALDARLAGVCREVETYLDSLQTACMSSFTQAEVLAYRSGDYLDPERFPWAEGLLTSDAAVAFILDTLIYDDSVNCDAARRIVCRGDNMSEAEWQALLLLFDNKLCTYNDILQIFQTYEYIEAFYPENGVTALQLVPIGYEREISEVLERLITVYSSRTQSNANQLLASGILMDDDYKNSEGYIDLKRILELGQLFMFLGACDTICPADFNLSYFAQDEYGFIIYKGEVYPKSDTDQLFAYQPDKLTNDLIDMLNAPESSKIEELQLSLAKLSLGRVAGNIPGASEILASVNAISILCELIRESNWSPEEQAAAMYSLASANRLLGGGEAYIAVPNGGSPTVFAMTTTPETIIRYAAIINDLDCISSPEDVVSILIDKDSEQWSGVRDYLADESKGQRAFEGKLSKAYLTKFDTEPDLDKQSFEILFDLIKEVTDGQ